LIGLLRGIVDGGSHGGGGVKSCWVKVGVWLGLGW
jgi:hypothetical protein